MLGKHKSVGNSLVRCPRAPSSLKGGSSRYHQVEVNMTQSSLLRFRSQVRGCSEDSKRTSSGMESTTSGYWKSAGQARSVPPIKGLMKVADQKHVVDSTEHERRVHIE